MKNVMLLAGAGQIGMAIARRMGTGMKIVVGDKKLENAQAIARTMDQAGFDVVPVEMDLSSRASIQSFIAEGQKHGPIQMLVNAAGVSPSQAPVEAILKVDLYDTVVLGSPVWWYTFAPAMHSFLKEADLAGKTVYPFATNGGWLGHTLKDFAKACKGAEVKPGLDVRFDGARLRTPEQDILRWAKGVQK